MLTQASDSYLIVVSGRILKNAIRLFTFIGLKLKSSFSIKGDMNKGRKVLRDFKPTSFSVKHLN